ncbi:MAG: hypothetical protein U0W24_02035 [Bacteroidales bacterium]
MKILVSFLLILIEFNFTAFGQTPQAFKYQAVARDLSGNVLVSKNISLRISILQGSVSGSSVYIETHSKTTNAFGLVDLEIGNGSSPTGNFSTINWAVASYYLKVEMDPSGGSDYQLMGTAQLLSVPYALHAKTAETVTKVKGIYNVVDYGAFTNNSNAAATSTAIQNAVNDCINGGDGVVYFPVGIYAINGPINVNLATSSKSIKIIGEGTGLTKLVFQSGANDGLNITFSNGALMDGYKGSIVVRDFTISCIGSNQGGTAIKLTGTGATSPMPGKEINNIVINGIGGSDCWTYGVRAINATYSNIYDINYGGPATASSVATHLGTGISIESNAGACDFFIRSCHFTHANIGINVLSNGSNGAEGVYVQQCAMVFVNTGVKWIAPSGSKEPCLFLTGTHINALQYNVYAENLMQAQISGNLFYQNSDFVANWIGIYINNTTNAADNDLVHINNNIIHGFKNLPPSSQAISLVRCGTASINNNLIYYCKRAIDFTTGSSGLYNANVVYNKFISCDLGVNGASPPSGSVVNSNP